MPSVDLSKRRHHKSYDATSMMTHEVQKRHGTRHFKLEHSSARHLVVLCLCLRKNQTKATYRVVFRERSREVYRRPRHARLLAVDLGRQHVHRPHRLAFCPQPCILRAKLVHPKSSDGVKSQNEHPSSVVNLLLFRQVWKAVGLEALNGKRVSVLGTRDPRPPRPPPQIRRPRQRIPRESLMRRDIRARGDEGSAVVEHLGAGAVGPAADCAVWADGSSAELLVVPAQR